MLQMFIMRAQVKSWRLNIVWVFEHVFSFGLLTAEACLVSVAWGRVLLEVT